MTSTEWFAVSGGYVQVHEDKVIILADDAESSSQIDVERARAGQGARRASAWPSWATRARMPTGSRATCEWADARIAVASSH